LIVSGFFDLAERPAPDARAGRARLIFAAE
jgi:hypothetical protein